MRKYIHITAAVLVLLTVTATSCKKSFLEIIPKGNLIAQNYSDYDLLMNSSSFYTFSNLGEWQAAMLMGDDVSGEQTFFNTISGQGPLLFQYKDDVFVPSSSSTSQSPLFLSQIFKNMYVLNKIINEVNSSAGGTDQQKQEIAAEAMATRAFANFQLINYFAKPYLASSASSDPGFPIITTADVAATNFTRGTVQGMYDFIIKDLTTAISSLNAQPVFATRWSKPAAEGFLGKVYLFMGRSADALAQFNAAFADIAKMGKPPVLYNYNQAFASGGSFLPVDPVNGPKTPFNNMTDMTESVVAVFSNSGLYDGNNFGNDFLSINPATKALFNPSDLRLNLFTTLQQNRAVIPGGRVRRFTISSSSYARIGLELPDLYLLRAEAKARTNDLAGAQADVETLRKNRMPAANAAVPTASTGNQTALIQFIINERSREFTGLGYRWWDMRRLSVDPLFSAQPLQPHTLYLTAGGTTQFTLNPARLTLRIPQFYLAAHPDMVDNP